MSNRAIKAKFKKDGRVNIVISLSPSSAPYIPKNDYVTNSLVLEVNDIGKAKIVVADLQKLVSELERDVLEKEVVSKVTSDLQRQFSLDLNTSPKGTRSKA